MEKGLYLVDWMADERGLYRVPMRIHAQEGAFLVMSWPEDRTLEHWGVPDAVTPRERSDWWGAFHRCTAGVLEDAETAHVWVNSALVRSLRRCSAPVR